VVRQLPEDRLSAAVVAEGIATYQHHSKKVIVPGCGKIESTNSLTGFLKKNVFLDPNFKFKEEFTGKKTRGLTQQQRRDIGFAEKKVRGQFVSPNPTAFCLPFADVSWALPRAITSARERPPPGTLFGQSPGQTMDGGDVTPLERDDIFRGILKSKKLASNDQVLGARLAAPLPSEAKRKYSRPLSPSSSPPLSPIEDVPLTAEELATRSVPILRHMGFWNKLEPFLALRLANNSLLETLERDHAHPLRLQLSIMGYHVIVVVSCRRRDYLYKVSVIQPDYPSFEPAKLEIKLRHKADERLWIDPALTAHDDLGPTAVEAEAARRRERSDDKYGYTGESLRVVQNLSPTNFDGDYDGQVLHVVLPWPGAFLEGDRVEYKTHRYTAGAHTFLSETERIFDWPEFGRCVPQEPEDPEDDDDFF
jgi:hypothetical protein